MKTPIQLLIKHLKIADMEYKEENIIECIKEDTEEGKLLNAMLEALTEALKISSNLPVSGSLPSIDEIQSLLEEELVGGDNGHVFGTYRASEKIIESLKGRGRQ